MKLFHPVMRRGLQKAAHFPAGMHKVAASPFAYANVLVRIFVQLTAIVAFQTVIVCGKVHRYKIQQHINSILMHLIHQLLQSLCRTIAGSRSKISRILISPALIAGMLAQRKKFHTVIAALFQVRNQNLPQFLIGIPVSLSCTRLFKGACMYLVNIEGLRADILPIL